MDTEFCLEALTDALERFGGADIFNTDQGSQFTSVAFTSALQDAGMRCLMDGRGSVFGQRVQRAAVALPESTKRCTCTSWTTDLRRNA